jgi:hypothetical protein
MPSPVADLDVLDTIGKLYAHGHGLNGYCRTCRRYFGRVYAGADRDARRQQSCCRCGPAYMRPIRRPSTAR